MNVDWNVATSSADLTRIHASASQHISGYDLAQAVRVTETLQPRLDSLFQGRGRAPRASTAVTATDAKRGTLLGAAIVEAHYIKPFQGVSDDDRRLCARYHYTLAGLFAVPEARRVGLGRALLVEAAGGVWKAGGRWLDGFVDRDSGSVGFYRRCGATVMSPNSSLPPRWPTFTHFTHPPSADGHWFFVDALAWYADRTRCSRCRGHLSVDPGDPTQPPLCLTCGEDVGAPPA